MCLCVHPHSQKRLIYFFRVLMVGVIKTFKAHTSVTLPKRCQCQYPADRTPASCRGRLPVWEYPREGHLRLALHSPSTPPYRFKGKSSNYWSESQFSHLLAGCHLQVIFSISFVYKLRIRIPTSVGCCEMKNKVCLRCLASSVCGAWGA